MFPFPNVNNRATAAVTVAMNNQPLTSHFKKEKKRTDEKKNCSFFPGIFIFGRHESNLVFSMTGQEHGHVIKVVIYSAGRTALKLWGRNNNKKKYRNLRAHATTWLGYFDHGEFPGTVAGS